MPNRTALGGTLVLGGGFAGGYVARLLGKRGATIVSPENFMLYTPILPEAASGTLEPRHVVVPLRMMCPHSELILGRAVALDTDTRRVRVQTDEELVEIAYEDVVVDHAPASAGGRMRTRSLAWTAGARARPTRSELGFPVDGRGRVRVDSTLRVEGLEHGWARGDAARVPNEATPEQPDPPTCQ